MIVSCRSGDDKIAFVEIENEVYTVRWLFKKPFESDWTNHWMMEGDSVKATAEEGKLLVDDYKGATLWNKRDYPADLLVRFKVYGIEREGNKTNFNLITHATGAGGSALVIGGESGRDGRYAQYHTFPNYLATFVYKWSRLRKNPGFHLLNERQESSVTGVEYEIVLTVQNGVLRYYIDGEKKHEIADDNPLGGGKVGLRTWDTKAYWYDVEIGEIIE